MNFYYKWTINIINKQQIIIGYHMKIFTNLQNPISSLYKCNFRWEYTEIYNIICS